MVTADFFGCSRFRSPAPLSPFASCYCHNTYNPRIGLTFGLLCLLPQYSFGKPEFAVPARFLLRASRRVGTHVCLMLPSYSPVGKHPCSQRTISRQNKIARDLNHIVNGHGIANKKSRPSNRLLELPFDLTHPRLSLSTTSITRS